MIHPKPSSSESPPGSAVVPPGRATASARSGQSIFVVDDDPDIVQLLEDVLDHEGFAVQGFTDPIAALATIAARPPDLILLDCIMPGIDGREFMKALAQDGIDTPIVLLTALSDPNFCVDTAHVVVLNKPFELDELLAEVTRVFDDSSQRLRSA
jgi:two-component system response regulator MprA